MLIHCHQGIQRSVSSVAANLMKYKGMQFRDVVRFLPSRRKQAFYEGTYLTFEKQLKQFNARQSLHLKDLSTK
jgi:protein-tyrosine phosphatase